MDDRDIIALYWNRSESAIQETQKKYGNFCFRIAYNVLASREDAEESVNDTYLKAWDSLPPQWPSILSAFLAKITRNLAITQYRRRSAAKRGGGEVWLALEELNECVANGQNVESDYIYQDTIRILRQLMDDLPEQERNLFLRRYFLLDPLDAIAQDFGLPKSKVKTILRRTRSKLRTALEKEDLL